MSLGEQIRIRRQATGMTYRAMAKAAGCSLANLWQIEAGQVDPSSRTLGRIADVLHCGVDELMERVPPGAEQAGLAAAMIQFLSAIGEHRAASDKLASAVDRLALAATEQRIGRLATATEMP